MRAVDLAGPAVDDLRRAGPVLAPRLLDDLRVLAEDEDPGAPLVADDSGFRLLTRAGGRGASRTGATRPPVAG